MIDGLAGLDIRWFANVRADYFNERHVSDELLKKARDAGAAYLGVGAESGSERILDLICKDITVEQILFTAKQMNKHNIVASYSFIIGIPSETKEEMLQTVGLMRKIKEVCPHSIFSGPQVLRPYPGGSLYDLCVTSGYHSPDSLEGWALQEWGKFGEIPLKNYPWIKDRALVIALSTYVPAALNYDFMKNLDFRRKAYSFIARIRLAFKFWFFPYEYKITMRLIKYCSIFRNRIKKISFFK